MNKKTKKFLEFCAGLLVGVVIGAFIAWQAIQIEHKNEEIAMLKEKLSQSQTERFKDILRFGQWKLQVEELAKENGWQLPEMSDSLVFMVEGPEFESHIVAEVVDSDSIHIIEQSTKIIDDSR